MCGERRSRDEWAIDNSKPSGFKGWCKPCESKKSQRYYQAHRERILEKAAARRGRSRPPARTTCDECEEPLPEGHRVICGKNKCKDARYRRLHPEAYAAREKAKVERRRERRRQLREEAASTSSPGPASPPTEEGGSS